MYAVIDLGTNSTRMIVGNIKAEQPEIPLRIRRVTRMGEGLGSEGEILPRAQERTINALKQFKQVLQDIDVEKLEVFATSVARRATDLIWLEMAVDDIFQKNLRILSGQEEAQLSYLGATKGLESFLTDKELPVVVDIGGGSSEVCTVVNDSLKAFSLEMGSVRGTENPISESVMAEQLSPLAEIINLQQPLKLVGTGGTITSLAAVEQALTVYDSGLVHGHVLKYTAVEEILQKLTAMTLAERQGVPGLEPERADIIIAGVKILLAIMARLACRELIVSESDLLDGMLYSMS